MGLHPRRLFSLSFLLLLPAISGGPRLCVAADDPPDARMVMMARSHFEKGMKLIGKGSEKEGEEELRESLRVFPDFADASIQLGNLAMRRREYGQGLELYLQAQASLLHLQGLSRQQEVERRRRLQEGIDALQERIEQLRLSQRTGAAGEIDAAMIRMEKLRQEQNKVLTQDEPPIPAELHFLIGTARMNLERYDEAIEDYRQALSQRPGYGEVHNNLAVIYLYRKDYPHAWEHLHAAEKAGIRINPQFREELSAAAPEPLQTP
jgi:tetratricopeptide (TPR) repeat protein